MDPKDLARMENLTELRFGISGMISHDDVLRFNRHVCGAVDEVDANALLIKQGFGWSVQAREVLCGHTQGGWVQTPPDEPPYYWENNGEEYEDGGKPEYSVDVALDPTFWSYASRSGRSSISFRKCENGQWEVEGVVTKSCLLDLNDRKIDVDVEHEGDHFRPSDYVHAVMDNFYRHKVKLIQVVDLGLSPKVNEDDVEYVELEELLAALTAAGHEPCSADVLLYLQRHPEEKLDSYLFMKHPNDHEAMIYFVEKSEGNISFMEESGPCHFPGNSTCIVGRPQRH